jgi:hypothetical protein
VDFRVNLPEDDVKPISSVLSCCYVQDYDKIDNSESWAVEFHNFRVYLAADKFGLLPLEQLAITRIMNWASSNWRSADFPDIVQEI